MFIVALLVAGMAPNEHVLIGCRIVQGAIAGILQPLSMYTLFRVFPPNQRGMAMGLFGMSVILGPALGPTVGGIMIEHFNWRYIFYIAVPSRDSVCCSEAFSCPSARRPRRARASTGPGFALLSTALACLLTGLSNGQREGWNSDFILTMFAISATAGIGFLLWELHTPQPLVDLRVLANGQFTCAATVACMFGMGLFGSVYLVPLFVQTVQGYTPYTSGTAPHARGPHAGPVHATGRLDERSHAGAHARNVRFDLLRPVVVLARAGRREQRLLDGRVGRGAVAHRPRADQAVAQRDGAASRCGRSCSAQGAGMINFARQLGGAFGVNLLSVTLDRRTFFHSDAMTSLQTAANSGTAELLRQLKMLLAQGGLPPDLQTSGALHYLGRVVHAQAYTMGFRDSFLLVAIIFTVGFIPAWIMGRAVARKEAVGRVIVGAMK